MLLRRRSRHGKNGGERSDEDRGEMIGEGERCMEWLLLSLEIAVGINLCSCLYGIKIQDED